MDELFIYGIVKKIISLARKWIIEDSVIDDVHIDELDNLLSIQNGYMMYHRSGNAA